MKRCKCTLSLTYRSLTGHDDITSSKSSKLYNTNVRHEMSRIHNTLETSLKFQLKTDRLIHVKYSNITCVILNFT